MRGLISIYLDHFLDQSMMITTVVFSTRSGSSICFIDIFKSMLTFGSHASSLNFNRDEEVAVGRKMLFISIQSYSLRAMVDIKT